MRKLALALVIAATLGATAANALGLGDVQLKSRLNQPLNADIQLVALRGLSPDNIDVKMANSEEFDKAGIERVYALNEIRFSVEGVGDNAWIRLQTKDAIREPFLNFIVEVNWPSGRLLREYTVLLDPPTFVDDAPVVSESVYSPPVASGDASSSGGEIVSAPVVSDDNSNAVSREEVQAPARAQPVSNSMAGIGSYGPTKASETLWGIASRVRPENASVHQTLVAIFKANPQAFANGNPNQLLQEQTLKIPSDEEILSTPRRKALADFVNQTGAVLETRAARQVTAASESSGRLVVSAPTESASPRSSDRAATSSREAAEVLNQENANLRNELNKQSKKAEQLEKLVKLKDEQLASIKPDETASTTSDAATENVEPASEPTPVTETPVESTEPVAAVDEQPVKPKPTVKVPQQVEEPSLLDTLMDNLLYILGGIGVVALIIGGMILHRRRVSNEKFQDTLLAPEPVAEAPLHFNDDLDLPEVGEDILAPQVAADDSIVGNDVVADPLGEADIYIAYGKFEQAEQLLTRALQDAPNRHELRVKLLECYAEMHDSDKFRSQVAMFQDVIDSDPSIASQVEQLQQRAWPKDDFSGGNTLPTADDIFGSVGVGAASETGSRTQETPIPSWTPSAAWDLPKTEEPKWDVPSEPQAEVSASGDDFSLDAHDDFGGFQSTKEESVPEIAADDFNFDLGESETSSSSWQSSTNESDSFNASSSSSDMMLDLSGDDSLPSGDELGMGEIDEIATKLDLARAYIEMHETDGAREILQEVVAEGNATQRKEAETLLSRL